MNKLSGKTILLRFLEYVVTKVINLEEEKTYINFAP